MDVSKLVRDAQKVHAVLQEDKSGRLVTTKGCKIQIPARFAERGLASIGSDIYICGIYAIISENKYYGVSLINAMHRIEPSAVKKTLINDDEYYEFIFDPGSVVFPSLDLVKTDTLPYLIFNEIISGGRVPWYVSYTDLGNLFESAKKHANADVGREPELMHLIASLISRDSGNRNKYYRQIAKSEKDQFTNPPFFVPMKSVTYSVTGTVSKLGGNYFGEGIVSSLVTPSERVENIEQILRS